MANINVVLDKTVSDGSKLKFRTPCDSNIIESLEVRYPAKNGVGTIIKKFVFKDAHGTELSCVGNLFVRGVMIEVLLDVTHGIAYIQNADTNSYVESINDDIQRIEKNQKQFLTVAGEAVERCENIADSADGFERAMKDAAERAQSVKGVYVGSGEMPDGYNIQIDQSGDVFEMDTELNAESKNPVTNSAVTKALDELRNQHIQDIAETDTKFATVGFGLGKVKAEITINNPSELDSLIKTGWYHVDFLDFNKTETNNTEYIFGVLFNYASVEVVSIDDYALYQTIYIHPKNWQSRIRRYWSYADGFSEWEFEVPPMVEGKEFRTTERYNGRAVYSKMLKIDRIPDDGAVRYTIHNEDVRMLQVISVQGTVKKAGSLICSTLPTYKGNTAGKPMEYLDVTADEGKVYIYASGDFSAFGYDEIITVVKYVYLD